MDSKPKHILIADDDKFILDILKKTMELEGFMASTADNGVAAVTKVKEVHPDLVILDIKMPGLDGYEVLTEIRKQSQVPVIMLTGIDEPKSIALTMQLGADDYIKKPFMPGELLARVRAKLRRAEAITHNSQPMGKFDS